MRTLRCVALRATVAPTRPESLARVMLTAVPRSPGFLPADRTVTFLGNCHEDKPLHLLEVEITEEVFFGLHETSLRERSLVRTVRAVSLVFFHAYTFSPYMLEYIAHVLEARDTIHHIRT